MATVFSADPYWALASVTVPGQNGFDYVLSLPGIRVLDRLLDAAADAIRSAE